MLGRLLAGVKFSTARPNSAGMWKILPLVDCANAIARVAIAVMVPAAWNDRRRAARAEALAEIAEGMARALSAVAMPDDSVPESSFLFSVPQQCSGLHSFPARRSSD